jgi:biopolymer transport protein TolR
MVVLMMAMFFSAAITTSPHRGVSADLPKVNHPVPVPHAQREDAMTMVIMRNGDLFFGRDRIAPDQLSDSIREQLRRGSEKKVYIRADALVHYRIVEAALDGIRSVGVENVAFLVEERPTNPLNRK